MPGQETRSAEMDVTQALQTLNARLTEAVAKTSTPTATLPPGTEDQPQPEESTSTPTTEASVTPTSSTSTVTPVPGDDCNQAAAATPIDITIEDDTKMAAGETFTKIWRVVNVGTCTWTTEYDVVFFSGELMGASPSQPLTAAVAPNQSVDLSVDMVAPLTSGTYQGNWKLRDAGGALFGIGPGSESPFWVRIVVVSETEGTSTPTPTPTSTQLVQASGSANLAVEDTLDLDSLLVNAGGSDLRYRTTLIDPKHQLVPLLGVTIGIFGNTQPGLPECQNLSKGGLPVILEDLSIGTYLCYRTDLGLPGWVRLDAFDQDTGAVTLQVLTWKVP